jgi:hypothetical protein
MWIRKEKAGGAPGFTWEADGDVLEIPAELGLDLLAIPEGGFTEVPAPAGETTGDETPAVEPDPDPITEVTEAPPEQAARKPATGRTAKPTK